MHYYRGNPDNFEQTLDEPNVGKQWQRIRRNGRHDGIDPNANHANSNKRILPYYGILFAVLIGVTVVGVIGVATTLFTPKSEWVQSRRHHELTQPVNGTSAYESVSKTLTDDERKIINVLQAHEGKYLQKYIKSETGLSRLQTHRIIARLSERGIVSLEKTGNTKQVYLANWLSQKQ